MFKNLLMINVILHHDFLFLVNADTKHTGLVRILYRVVVVKLTEILIVFLKRMFIIRTYVVIEKFSIYHVITVIRSY